MRPAFTHRVPRWQVALVACAVLGALAVLLLGMAGRPGYAFQVSSSGLARTVAQRAADPSPQERYAVFCEREPECHHRAARLCRGDYDSVPSEGWVLEPLRGGTATRNRASFNVAPRFRERLGVACQ